MLVGDRWPVYRSGQPRGDPSDLWLLPGREVARGGKPHVKLMRVGRVGAERPAVLAEDGRLLDLSGITADIDGAFLAGDGPDRVRAAVAAGLLPELDAGDLRIGAPVARPGKVVCIGLNYRDHARETGAAIPMRPVVFMKDPGTVVGPEDRVLIPRQSQKTDWEVELAVVIGQRAHYLASPLAAMDVVAGYAVSNDVSEREFQLEFSGQWDLGKSCETFNPLGPWLVTPDEAGDPQALGLRLSVNGGQRQDGNTRDMVFDVAHIVWYLSQYLVLEPGDVINTGTPAGVALGLPDHPYLRAGDVVELTVDGLGTQRQTFEQA
jgi:2-keto-4-pentenoate hydratase/2-oxohepta-3-ene-1,7-dioic acid hydratase in catechol pathway